MKMIDLPIYKSDKASVEYMSVEVPDWYDMPVALLMAGAKISMARRKWMRKKKVESRMKWAREEMGNGGYALVQRINFKRFSLIIRIKRTKRGNGIDFNIWVSKGHV